MPSKRKYNSVATICFEVHHDESDGSDLTLDVVWLALFKRCLGIQAESGEGVRKQYMLGEVFDLEDTTENQEVKMDNFVQQSGEKNVRGR